MINTVKKTHHDLPKVALVGRVNVGKSTLFNRLVGDTTALVSDIPGTTRDTKSGMVEWQGISFELIDTGGYIGKSQSKTSARQSKKIPEDVQDKIIKHTKKAIKNADLVLFLVDTITGITPIDRKIAKILSPKTYNLKPILVANKADNATKRNDANVFIKLGLGEPITVSSINGSGTGDLLDEITIKFKSLSISNKSEIRNLQSEITNICILGKPNTGKSTLLNAIIGEEYAIVSPKAHTTREPNDVSFEYKNRDYTLVDTAGIRRKSQKGDPLEKGGITMSLKALKKSNIAWLVLDVESLISTQDRRLAREIVDSGKSCIIVVNKWDLEPDKTTDTPDEFRRIIYSHFPHLKWAPILFVSALNGKSVEKILTLTNTISPLLKNLIPDSSLSRLLKRAITHQPPPMLGAKKRRPYLSKLKQIGTTPPHFSFESSSLYKLPTHYVRYIENQLREKFKFIGSPIRITVINRKEPRPTKKPTK